LSNQLLQPDAFQIIVSRITDAFNSPMTCSERRYAPAFRLLQAAAIILVDR